ncbi:uncharacterized protein EI90DRAFT_3153136 [Cantharellus anzutake]|uniref:uncharacterized protein n=1 Tax=Cantharellus anzutake TaxID=1750568 RepID=UPI0019063E5B|nr:uncharacterized protein EI90DRAFT_3153136 [Cantharellus anzutake]KAF8334976.1 hypothetical protein EI90DRAFT_3153136 [Cantharellus anzutake]
MKAVGLVFRLLPFAVGGLGQSLSGIAGYSSRKAIRSLDLSLEDNICSFDAIVVVHQPGLSLDDLYAAPSSSLLSSLFSDAPWKRISQRTVPAEPSDLLKSIQDRCQYDITELHLGQLYEEKDASNIIARPKIISLPLPHLTDKGRARKVAMSFIVSELARDLQIIGGTFESHFVMFASVPYSTTFKREMASTSNSPFFIRQATHADPVHGYAGNTTLPEGGILQRYQLLTPGILTILLVVVLVFFPILHVGISALSSIKTSQRMDNPHKDRKGQ